MRREEAYGGHVQRRGYVQRPRAARHEQGGIGHHLTELRQPLVGAVDPAVAAVGQQLGRQLFRLALLPWPRRQHALQFRAGLVELDDEARVLLYGEVVGRAAAAGMHHQPGAARIQLQAAGDLLAHLLQALGIEAEVGPLGLHHAQLLVGQEAAHQIQVVLVLRLLGAGTALYQPLVVEHLGQLGGRGQPVGNVRLPHQLGVTGVGEEADGGIEGGRLDAGQQGALLFLVGPGTRIQDDLVNPGTEAGQRRRVGGNQGSHMTLHGALEHGKARPGQHEVTNLVIADYQNTFHKKSLCSLSPMQGGLMRGAGILA